MDADRLQKFLGFDDQIEVRQFPAGFSNLTYLIRAGGKELVLRRPPFGVQIKSAHDMAREYRILSALQGVYGRAPRPVAYCGDADVLGAPFYVMERLHGVVLRAKAPQGTMLDPECMRRLSENFIDNLADIHGIDVAKAGLQDLGRGEGYVRRQVEGWTKRFQAAQTESNAEMEALAGWLGSNMPDQAGVCLIHNDYKYDTSFSIRQI